MSLMERDSQRLGPPKDEATMWESLPTAPVYDAEWVDATVLEFVEGVDAMPSNKRLQGVQDYIEEGIIELRDTVRFSCDIYQGFPYQDENYMSNIDIVSGAIRRVSFWEQQLQHRVQAGSTHYEDLLPSLDKFIPQKNTIHDENHDTGDDQPMDICSQSSDDQPMDISSGSSDDGGGIITKQKEKMPKNAPEPQSSLDISGHHPSRQGHAIKPSLATGSSTSHAAPTSPANSCQRKKKRMTKGERERAKRAHQSTSRPPALGAQNQTGLRSVGSLPSHPSLPPRPPTSSVRGWLPNMDAAGEGVKKGYPRYSAMQPRYNVSWVDATLLEFVAKVRHKPPTERAARVRLFLKNELPEIRDMIKAQWCLGDGWFLCEYGDIQNNHLYEALKKVDKWQLNLEDKARADEANIPAYLALLEQKAKEGERKPHEGSSGEDGNNKTTPALAPTADTTQPTLPQKDSNIRSQSSDDQPMDISSTSSEDGGGIIIKQKEKMPKNAPKPEVSGASNLPTPKPSSP
ncbi:hypothetical protein PG994_011069 [Apiospora phragmitis]|uniref:Uncharacterized protein n=1 Tax=Apiospora phragmitis TaxID=2905665 RepID=A0ABR1TUE6_9PEZI